MSESNLIPSIDNRLSSLLEMSRRQAAIRDQCSPQKPTITISRAFGCEAYPMGELLRQQMEKRTNESWALMDKSLLDEVTKNHHLSEQVLENLGEKNRFLDDFFSTFSNNWKSDKDYYRLLSRQIIALAEQGNVILVGRGASIVTCKMKNCFNFRIFGSEEFKVASIAKRLGLDEGEARTLVERRQKERNKFIRDFLDRDPCDLSVYHLIFNNDRNNAIRTAQIIADYVLSE